MKISEIELVNVNGVYVNLNCRIEWLIKENCKRRIVKGKEGKSWRRMEGYIGSKNIREYLEGGGSLEDLKYDEDRKYFKLLDKDVNGKVVKI